MMSIDLALIASLLLNLGLLFIVHGQRKNIQVLRRQKQSVFPYETDEGLIAETKEKIQTIGEVKTIKHLRMEKGMSMIEAKKFIDSLKENEE